LWEVNEAAKTVQEAAHPDANIIFGAMLDEKLSDEVWITVVATGYDQHRNARKAARRDALSEPAGEPRVSRLGEPRRRSSVEVDVPEYIPRY
jgi:cell division protein FtsZ